MKKFLTFILVLAAVLSVYSIALAAEIPVTYDPTKTEKDNGNILSAAFKAAADGDKIIIGEGTYTFDDDYDARIWDKGLTLVGAGEGKTIINSYKYGFVLQGHPSKRITYNIENMTINSGCIAGWGQPIYVKGNTEVNLKDVTLHNVGTTTTAILVDSANQNSALVCEPGITATVNATNVTIDVGNTVELLANPSTEGTADIDKLSYAEFNYNNCTNIVDANCIPQPGKNYGLDNLTVNEKCINPAVAQIGTTKYATLQAAIDAAQDAARTQPETVTIKLLADVSKDVISKQEENLNLVIDGDGHKMTGTIYIYGDSRYTGAETLTIQNIAFEKDSGDAISSDSTDGDKRYAHNVFIKDCTFTGDAIVGTRIRQGYNINIIDCVMNSGHSLMQNTNNTGITVTGTTVNASEGGLNLFKSTGVRVEGCDITAGDYGVRVDADGSGDATIKDTKIDAEQPVIIRNVTNSYTLTAKYGNIFTVGDGKLPVNIIDGDASKVNYTDYFVAMNGTTNTYYNSWDKAIADAKPGETVYPVENGDPKEDGAVTIPKPSTGSGISVKYNGGNSFSTSKSDVPTGVEIDGVPVTFNGNGSNFTVGCISSDAKWVTVRWNSTTVTTNFTPDGLVECTTVSIPKTGDMSIWAAIAEFLGF